MVAYWYRAIQRAWRDTLSCLGFPRSARLAVIAISFIIAIILLQPLGGGEQVSEELRWGIAIALAASILFVPTFLFNLLSAPPRMEREVTEKATRTELTLEEQIQDLQGQLDDRERKRAIRLEINHFIQQGNNIVSQLRRLEDSSQIPQYRTQVNEWTRTVREFIEREAADFTGHFLSEGGFGVQGVQAGPIERANLVNYMGRRLSRLGELLARV